MRYAIDSSSIINLYNAGVLGVVSHLEQCEFWLPPLVVGECEPSCATEVLALQQQGRLHFFDDDSVPADLFIELLTAHGLGNGETECIAVALTHGYNVCCDDRKAREAAGRLLAPERVIGTLRLLRWCVEAGILEGPAAYAFYILMKDKGGFLPNTEQGFFCGNE